MKQVEVIKAEIIESIYWISYINNLIVVNMEIFNNDIFEENIFLLFSLTFHLLFVSPTIASQVKKKIS